MAPRVTPESERELKQFRHGDVFLQQIDTVPLGVCVERKGDLILAEGEVTGHAHRIRSTQAYKWSAAQQTYVEVTAEDGVDLTHEEHGTIHIPAGVYEVRIQRIYVPARSAMRVAD